MVRSGAAGRNVRFEFAGGQGHVQRFGPLLHLFFAQDGLLEGGHERKQGPLQGLPAFFELSHVSDPSAPIEDYFVNDLAGL